MTTEAAAVSSPQVPEQERSERAGLAAFIAAMGAMTLFVASIKSLRVPWMFPFSCNCETVEELQQLQQLIPGSTLHPARPDGSMPWLEIPPSALDEHLPGYVAPEDLDRFYMPMAVHVRDSEREAAPL